VILTGPAISAAQRRGDLIIEPFDPAQINPNSYNFRLGPQIREVTNTEPHGVLDTIPLNEEGHVLQPRRLYLGATVEVIGSPCYAVTLLGRSSLGRLGLFLNITADLGHAGCCSQWTLELTTVQPLRIYPNMLLGQVAFWQQYGRQSGYVGRYHRDVGPQPSRDIGLYGASQ
jgi:dCTP deaminase